jgi:hypothetical protein
MCHFIYIVLKDFMVAVLFNFSVYYTVVCKKSNMGINVLGEIINIRIMYVLLYIYINIVRITMAQERYLVAPPMLL